MLSPGSAAPPMAVRPAAYALQAARMACLRRAKCSCARQHAAVSTATKLRLIAEKHISVTATQRAHAPGSSAAVWQAWWCLWVLRRHPFAGTAAELCRIVGIVSDLADVTLS